jgi:hypothetical protein
MSIGHLADAAEIIANKHNTSTGQALDILIRLAELLDAGIPKNEILVRLNGPSTRFSAKEVADGLRSLASPGALSASE